MGRNQVTLFAFILFITGFNGLIFETLMQKIMGYYLGISLTATSFVLLIFFIGTSLGGFYWGKFTEKFRSPLLAFGLMESFIGIYIAAIPMIYSLLRAQAWGHGNLVYLLLMAVLLILPPTFIMGGTLPFILKFLSTQNEDHDFISLMYATNTLGASFGVLIASYYLFPVWGLGTSCVFSGLSNLAAAFIPLGLYGEIRVEPKLEDKKEPLPRTPKAHLAISYLLGLIAFSCEVAWFNILALVLGNSTYAFAIMLFSVLLGMALGAYATPIFLRGKRSQGHYPMQVLFWVQLALATALYFETFLWDSVGDIFGKLGILISSFSGMELCRFLVAFSLLCLPTILIGLSFPLVLTFATRNDKKVGATSGRILAVNGAGCISGILLTGLVLINFFGIKNTFHLIGGMAILISLLIDFSCLRQSRRKLQLSSFFLLAFLLLRFPLSPEWDLLRMTKGENVYFEHVEQKQKERLIYYKESTFSGAISITQAGSTKTLYTNGKFEGNDGFEILDQYLFGLIPGLFVGKYGEACNIGLGVGGTLGALSAFPFSSIDVVDLSPDIFTLARDHFSQVNFDALKDPRVHTHVVDGRNFLYGRENRYDLIFTEITSIWFAGAGNLYNKEFYQTAAAALKDGGIIGQWFQIPHLPTEDLVRIAKTMKSSFPHLTLWVQGHQGILVGSKNSPLTVPYLELQRLSQSPSIQRVLKSIHYKRTTEVFRHLYMDTPSLDNFIREMEEQSGEYELSTDLNPILEYSTPRGNADSKLFRKNMDLLLTYKWRSIKNLITSIPSPQIYDQILDDSFPPLPTSAD